MNELLGDYGVTTYNEVYESFDVMGLQENLLRGLYAYRFEKPSLIQQKGIVPFCKGLDVIQQAPSGTSKTVMICSGILQKLDYSFVQCQALVLALTSQHVQHIEKLMWDLGVYLGVKVHVCVGGTSVQKDQRIRVDGVHVVVGTPGRVLDMLRRLSLGADYIKMLFLDEADALLSRGFKDQICSIFHLLPAKVHVSVSSATMPPEALEIVRKFMNQPVRVILKSDELNLEVSAYHGDMNQSTRDITMREFLSGSSRVLITFDLLARVTDIHHVLLVINYDLPTQLENYLRRIG
ncbi:Eukaryotic initiation factor 4A-1 [Hibiscus syriacus]|uniref:RNA helicase n=1 Tax=Hibiscus syriacus TaxID=106335 RepID=A0A6A2XHX3_HIBSY|nr:Eukaryotic initiation factor 4A-1 [Hibiscus syriacus]